MCVSKCQPLLLAVLLPWQHRLWHYKLWSLPWQLFENQPAEFHNECNELHNEILFWILNHPLIWTLMCTYLREWGLLYVDFFYYSGPNIPVAKYLFYPPPPFASVRQLRKLENTLKSTDHLTQGFYRLEELIKHERNKYMLLCFYCYKVKTKLKK